jgi:hypothetical protein
VIRAPAIRALGLVRPAGAPGGLPVAPGDAGVVSLGPRRRPGDRYRRTPRECLLAIEAVEAALADAGADRSELAGERTGLVYVTASAYAASNRAFIEGTGGSIHFPYTAAAAVPAEAAIDFGLTGPYGILIGGPPATLSAIWQAGLWLEGGDADRVLVLAVETLEECADLHRRARRLVGRPLVEAAGCLWLEPGAGELTLAWDAGRGGGPAAPHLACEPLVALGAWRGGGAGPDVALEAAWRGRRARLAWTRACEAARAPSCTR